MNLLISVFHSLVNGSERVPDEALVQGHDGEDAQDVPATLVRLERHAGVASGRGREVLAVLHDCEHLCKGIRRMAQLLLI